MILIESIFLLYSIGISKPKKIEQKQITQQKTIEPNKPTFLYKKSQSRSRIGDKKVCKQIQIAELSILTSSGKNVPLIYQGICPSPSPKNKKKMKTPRIATHFGNSIFSVIP